MPEVFVDVAALAQLLQQLPLHQRLNLEAEMVQVSCLLAFPQLLPNNFWGISSLLLHV